MSRKKMGLLLAIVLLVSTLSLADCGGRVEDQNPAEDWRYWQGKLNMQPIHEGGYFREIYRSPDMIEQEHLPSRYDGPRCYSTSGYFLLPKGEFSAFHRLKSDEVWHYYFGGTFRMHIFDPEGNYSTVLIGKNVGKGEVLMLAIKHGSWFGGEPVEGFALVGNTVSPGFDFSDFELGKRDDLIKQFPQYADLISRLTRD